MFSPEKLTKCELIRCRGKSNPLISFFRECRQGIKGLDSFHPSLILSGKGRITLNALHFNTSDIEDGGVKAPH